MRTKTRKSLGIRIKQTTITVCALAHGPLGLARRCLVSVPTRARFLPRPDHRTKGLGPNHPPPVKQEKPTWSNTTVTCPVGHLKPLRLRLRRFVLGRFLFGLLLQRFALGSFPLGSLRRSVLRRFLLGSFWVLISRTAAFKLIAFQIIWSSFGFDLFRIAPLANNQ
jgi:hypothetical protein